MKKITILLSLVTSLILLTGCASHCAEQAQAPMHHDLKGEVSK